MPLSSHDVARMVFRYLSENRLHRSLEAFANECSLLHDNSLNLQRGLPRLEDAVNMGTTLYSEIKEVLERNERSYAYPGEQKENFAPIANESRPKQQQLPPLIPAGQVPAFSLGVAPEIKPGPGRPPKRALPQTKGAPAAQAAKRPRVGTAPAPIGGNASEDTASLAVAIAAPPRACLPRKDSPGLANMDGNGRRILPKAGPAIPATTWMTLGGPTGPSTPAVSAPAVTPPTPGAATAKPASSNMDTTGASSVNTATATKPPSNARPMSKTPTLALLGKQGTAPATITVTKVASISGGTPRPLPAELAPASAASAAPSSTSNLNPASSPSSPVGDSISATMAALNTPPVSGEGNHHESAMVFLSSLLSGNACGPAAGSPGVNPADRGSVSAKHGSAAAQESQPSPDLSSGAGYYPLDLFDSEAAAAAAVVAAVAAFSGPDAAGSIKADGSPHSVAEYPGSVSPQESLSTDITFIMDEGHPSSQPAGGDPESGLDADVEQFLDELYGP